MKMRRIIPLIVSAWLLMDANAQGMDVVAALAKIQVGRFECEDCTPVEAIAKLMEAVAIHDPEIPNRVHIRSLKSEEPLLKRNGRYTKITLSVEKDSALEVFKNIIRMSLWHFESKPDGLVVNDWHRGEPVR